MSLFVFREGSCALSKLSTCQKSCVKSYVPFFPFLPPFSPSREKAIPFSMQFPIPLILLAFYYFYTGLRFR